jgi:zinc transport system ATP-binding protein
MNTIKIKNLSFAYERDTVLEDINLQINDRDFLAVIGPNGGGKSTLCKLIIGLLKPDTGSITINDKKISKSLSQIGYVPQNTNVNTHFPIKVIEVVMMGHVGDQPPLIGYKKEEFNCAYNALRQVGMQELAHKKIGELSGGQRQRVMIARALCAHPKILLLDEPTSNIDIQGQKQIYELLQILNKSITVIVVSHDISLILQYATKAAYINKKLTFHSLSNEKTKKFFSKDEHFCEIELLQMLGK